MLQGNGAVIIGNLTEPLDSGILAHALTATIWSDRKLGKSETVHLPMRWVWVTNANNPELSLEMARRSIRIRLDSQQERPWERTEFRHPKLRQWARRNRADLVRAALIIVQSWAAAEMPRGHERNLGSYEEWAEIMGGILTHAEIPGFLENLDDLYQVSDLEGIQWQNFIQGWWERHSEEEKSSADLVKLALECGVHLNASSPDAYPISLGKQLTQRRDQIIGDFRLIRVQKGQRQIAWQLHPVTEKSEGSDGR